MKNSIIAFITVVSIFYLAGSFVAASFDIQIWGINLRTTIAVFALIISAFAISLICDKK